MAIFFTLNELIKSPTALKMGIDNTPTEKEKTNLVFLMENCLDEIRKLWGRPIFVNSGFRCEELNNAIHGANNSQHKQGEAADITTGSRLDNKKLFDLIALSNIPFDQLIDERNYSWLHISCKNKNIGNRRQILHL